MEKRRNGIDKQLPRRCNDHPSFSSTLLDAIYRSIDETDSRGAPDRALPAKKQSAPCFPDGIRRTTPPPAFTHPRRAAAAAAATSSSSDASSYGGFSSSDTESAPTPRLRPIRTTPAVRSARFDPPVGPTHFTDKSAQTERRHGSIRSCLRDLRSARSPSSPGARIASFIGSLFAAKSKVSAESTAEGSSQSRSCLSKTPSTAKRTVRFCPVSVVVGEELPAVRRSEEEEDEEEDLFELKNLAVMGRFRDGLPVYETTRIGKYSGFVL